MRGTAFDHLAVIEGLVAAPDVDSRWRFVTRHLAAIGMDQINYGVIDDSEADRLAAPIRFLSTMDPGWIDYYGDRAMYDDDPHVTLVRGGNLRPYRWGESRLDGMDDDPAGRDVLGLAAESGLRCQLQVTLPDQDAGLVPVGGMAMGSSLGEDEYFRAIRGREAELATIAYLFHQCSIGEVRRRHRGIPRLSSRERDALQFVASGLRAEAIAHRMGIARVTVELHLRSARRKLKAATLPHAVARAIMFQEIAAA
jgi:DNA-binding CsgD family transcriptional regulator